MDASMDAFQTLLWDCLKTGTTLAERGKRTSAASKSNELLLLFGLDNESFRTAFFGKKQDVRVCDGLYLRRTEEGSSTLLFVELKGTDVAHAVSQLESTIKAFKSQLDSQRWKRTTKKALVVHSGSTPKNNKALQDDFNKHYAVTLHFCGKKEVDIWKHL